MAFARCRSFTAAAECLDAHSHQAAAPQSSWEPAPVGLRQWSPGQRSAGCSCQAFVGGHRPGRQWQVHARRAEQYGRDGFVHRHRRAPCPAADRGTTLASNFVRRQPTWKSLSALRRALAERDDHVLGTTALSELAPIRIRGENAHERVRRNSPASDTFRLDDRHFGSQARYAIWHSREILGSHGLLFWRPRRIVAADRVDFAAASRPSHSAAMSSEVRSGGAPTILAASIPPSA